MSAKLQDVAAELPADEVETPAPVEDAVVEVAMVDAEKDVLDTDVAAWTLEDVACG